jgi:hypothetical protein
VGTVPNTNTLPPGTTTTTTPTVDQEPGTNTLPPGTTTPDTTPDNTTPDVSHHAGNRTRNICIGGKVSQQN